MFSVPTLSIGDVAVRVRPVRSAAQLRTIVGAVRSIKGVDRVVVDRIANDEARLHAHTDRPVALASEIRGALRRRVASCTVQDGDIVIDLDTELDPAHRAPDGTHPHQERIVRDRREAEPMGGFGGMAGFEGLPADIAAVEALNDIAEFTILLFDRDQRFTACTGGLHRRFGHEFVFMQGRRAEEILSAQAWATLGPGYNGAVGGQSSSIEFVSSDGTVTESWFRPLRDEREIVGGMVLSRDVTRQRQTQHALDELSAVLRVVFDRSALPYALVAPDGRWVRVNAAMQDLLGVDEATLVCELALERTHPDDLHQDREAFVAVAAGHRESSAMNKRIRTAGGHWLRVNAETTAIRTDNRLCGLVVSLTAR